MSKIVATPAGISDKQSTQIRALRQSVQGGSVGVAGKEGREVPLPRVAAGLLHEILKNSNRARP